MRSLRGRDLPAAPSQGLERIAPRRPLALPLSLRLVLWPPAASHSWLVGVLQCHQSQRHHHHDAVLKQTDAPMLVERTGRDSLSDSCPCKCQPAIFPAPARSPLPRVSQASISASQDDKTAPLQSPVEPSGPSSRAEMISNPDYRTNGKPLEQAIASSVHRAVQQGQAAVLQAEGSTAAAMPSTDEMARQEDAASFDAVYDNHRAALGRMNWNTHASYKQDEWAPAAAPAAAAPADPAAPAGAAPADPAAAPAPAALLQLSQEPEPAAAAESSGRPGGPDGPESHLLRMEPIPGASARAVDVFPLNEVGGNLANTANYANMHSYQEDLRELVKELDSSEARAQALRLMIVEKDNFLEGLQKRERLLRLDMTEHKNTLAALSSHVQAVEARIERLKQERQVAEIAAQKHQFELASMKLQSEVNNVQQVSGALDERIRRLGAGIAANQADEVKSMRLSLQPTVAVGEESDNGAANAAAAAVPAMSLVQKGSAEGKHLRGALAA